MFESIFKSIADILSYILMVVGCEEFIKNCIAKKKLDLNSIMQIVLCFIGSLAYCLKSKEMTLYFIVDVIYISLLLVSTTTLFYDLIIKKIKDETKNKINIT